MLLGADHYQPGTGLAANHYDLVPAVMLFSEKKMSDQGMYDEKMMSPLIDML